MQILSVPYTHHDMSYSISMTGITKLKEGRFKQRHNLKADLTQTPREGIITSKRYKTLFPTKPKTRRKRKVNSPVEQPISKKPTSVKQYKIDKVQVCHRIKQYVNQMKGEKMLYFWTITFPKGTSDDTTYILMNKWLTRLRQESLLKEYLWITERQENGTIHFHMVVNK